jgi:glycosyltransferase involved in cell wall biosynthesis
MQHSEPFLSVIVPTYARPQQLATCLCALSQQNYPRERFEVIVVNDGGTTLKSHLDAFLDRLNIKYIAQRHAGPANARNTGAEWAQGMFLVFTDDDCMPNSDWLQKLALRFAQTPTQIIGGLTLNALESNAYSTVSQAIIDIAYSYYNAVPSQARFFASNNLAIPAAGFRELGGFDTSFETSEDRNLCDRWLHCGYRMTYAAEAIVAHAHPLTLAGFCVQHFNYGRGAFRFHQFRAASGAGRLLPDWQFHLLVLRRFFAVPHLLPIWAMWHVANTAGFLWEMICRRSRSKQLPVAYRRKDNASVG